MNNLPKHKFGTTIAIEKQKIRDYFSNYFNHQTDGPEESYQLIDGSLLVLKPSGIPEKAFVHFHLKLQIDQEDKSVSFQGKNWLMDFCKEYDSQIQNLRTKVVMPVSEGAIMGDIMRSETFRLSLHAANHPKDIKNNRLI